MRKVARMRVPGTREDPSPLTKGIYIVQLQIGTKLWFYNNFKTRNMNEKTFS